MKKTLRNMILSLLAVFTFAISGCSCFNFTETYSGHGMSITMDKGFEETTYGRYDWVLEKKDASMFVSKEEFQANFNPENFTLEEYTNAIQTDNSTNHPTHVRENEGYIYYTYTASAEGNTYFYMVTTHQSSDAFWLIQFFCFIEDKDSYEEKFLTWADSVTFDADQTTNPGENV